MRKIYIIMAVISLLTVNFAVAQDVKSTEEYQFNVKAYNKAMKYNDIPVARDALIRLISMDENDVTLLDSLAILYFEYRQYASVILVCRDILALQPNNSGAVELSANSLEQLQLFDQALVQYEKLYLMNEDVLTLYKVATLQLQLNRAPEFTTNADILLGKEESSTIKLYFNDADNQQQEIPMSASLYNMKGILAQESGDLEAARGFYQSALEIAPEFYLAKANLEGLDK